MKVLLTGGSGKTSSRLAALLHAANIPLLTTSRSPQPSSTYPCAAFDWFDPSTHKSIFASDAGKDVDRVWLVAPPAPDMLTPMAGFIATARAAGVTRFVLLSASTFDETAPAMGTVHSHLKTLGETEGVEWAVLRPTWFMENWVEASHPIAASIRASDTVYSATGAGVIPWISADDIARVALATLTAPTAPNTAHLLLGPQLFSYSDVAALISRTVGREIRHISLERDELAKYLVETAKIPEGIAQMLAALDVGIAGGSEARTNNVVEAVTGRLPKTMEEFVSENKGVWAKA